MHACLNRTDGSIFTFFIIITFVTYIKYHGIIDVKLKLFTRIRTIKKKGCVTDYKKILLEKNVIIRENPISLIPTIKRYKIFIGIYNKKLFISSIPAFPLSLSFKFIIIIFSYY